MAIPWNTIIWIGGAIILVLAIGVPVGVRNHRKKHPKLDNSGEKEIQKLESKIKNEDDKIEKDVDNALDKGANEEKPHGGEKKKEKQIEEAAGAASTEKELDNIGIVEEKIEKDTEHEEDKAPDDLKAEDKREAGGEKLKGIAKKEEKTEVKAEKAEGAAVEAEEKAEVEIVKDLKAALTLMSATEQIAKESKVSALIEMRTEKLDTELTRKINGFAGYLGRLGSFQQIDLVTINWLKGTLLPTLFEEFEAKLKLALYANRVEKSLMIRLEAAKKVSREAINRLKKHMSNLGELEKLGLKKEKETIKKLNKDIKLKIKELKRVRQKAKSEQEKKIAGDLLREIGIIEGHKARMEMTAKEIGKTESVTDKNTSRAKKMIGLLENRAGAIAAEEERMSKVHEDVQHAIKSIENIVEDTSNKIEDIYREQKTFEEIAVDAMGEVKKFFDQYGKILNLIEEFNEDIKKLMQLCINMAHNERSLFFLLDGIERAQTAMMEGSQVIIEMSEAIIQADEVEKADLDVYIKDLSYSEQEMRKLEQLTVHLEKAGQYVQAQTQEALKAIDMEIAQIAQVKRYATTEENVILTNVRLVATKIVDRKKKVDDKYLSPVAEFQKAAVDSRKASDHDYKLAA